MSSHSFQSWHSQGTSKQHSCPGGVATLSWCYQWIFFKSGKSHKNMLQKSYCNKEKSYFFNKCIGTQNWNFHSLRNNRSLRVIGYTDTSHGFPAPMNFFWISSISPPPPRNVSEKFSPGSDV